jgi:hypothetical protein
MRAPRSAQALAVAAGLALSVLSCAETTPSAPAPANGSATGKLAGPPEVGWADMNKDQRIDYMKSVVLPRMKVAFTNFNPDRYSGMNCVTCHGDSAADGSFKMPNPRLPKLPTTPEGFRQLAEEKPAVMEFMKNEVKPRMASMLGVPDWNPETKSGFGCMECHTPAQ